MLLNTYMQQITISCIGNFDERPLHLQKIPSCENRTIVLYSVSEESCTVTRCILHIVPRCTTLDDLLNEYVALYGKNSWSLSTYTSNTGLIKNYIHPVIGQMKIQDICLSLCKLTYQDCFGSQNAQNQKQRPSCIPV